MRESLKFLPPIISTVTKYITLQSTVEKNKRTNQNLLKYYSSHELATSDEHLLYTALWNFKIPSYMALIFLNK
jgi:hypothetical protein